MANTEHGLALYEIGINDFKTHLGDRAEAYAKKNQELISEAKAISARQEAGLAEQTTVSDRMNMKGGSDYTGESNRREQLMRQAGEMARQARRFEFLEEHAHGDSLLLCEAELRSLEFI